MRRRLIAAIAVVLVLAAGALAWGHWNSSGDPEQQRSWLDRLVTAIGLGGSDAAATFSGYVEADYVMVTSSIGGTLMKLEVARGDQVAAGAPLFALDDAAEHAARDEAAAKLAQAESQLANLRLGRRQPEIDAIVAQRAQAEAALRQSEADFERQVQLRAHARLQPEAARRCALPARPRPEPARGARRAAGGGAHARAR